MPNPIPDTLQSLLMRIKNPHNADAWREFDAIYRPAIYRFARRRGLQRQDAEDIAQQVLAALCNKIGGWKPDQREGSFRAWLLTVARNATTNKLSRRARDAGQG